MRQISAFSQNASPNSDRRTACVGIVVMASGRGLRFGPAGKLFADFHGRPLAEPVLKTALTAPAVSRIAVTRSPDFSQFCQKLGFPCLLHSLPGLNDTIRLGLSALVNPMLTNPQHCLIQNDVPFPHSSIQLDGCMFLQSDQPFLTAASLKEMILSFSREPRFIYRLACGTDIGSPVLFPAELFPELLSLPHNCGGSFVIQKHAALVRTVQAATPYELLDADTQEALAYLRTL